MSTWHEFTAGLREGAEEIEFAAGVELPPALPTPVSSAVAPEHSWKPLDIVELGTDPPKPPEIAGLFYLGMRHNLAGESEAAKTWLALAAAADELKAGRPVDWVDGDLVGPAALLERLRSFDVPDATIRAAFRYFSPEGPLSDPSELVEALGDGRLAGLREHGSTRCSR